MGLLLSVTSSGSKCRILNFLSNRCRRFYIPSASWQALQLFKVRLSQQRLRCALFSRQTNCADAKRRLEFLGFSVNPAEPSAAQSTQSNLFRLKTRASRVSTVPAPHRSIHNEAYVVYAFRQTHNPSTFTAPDRQVGRCICFLWKMHRQ